MTRKVQIVPQNRNATIRTRLDKNGNLRTETARRDSGTTRFAVSTDTASNATRLFVDAPDGDTYLFDGREARTLYRMLQKHYSAADRTR